MASNKNKDKSSKPNSYLKYAGLSMQMFVGMLIAGYAGSKLDNYWELDKPYLTATFMLFMLLGIFVKIYYDLQ